MARSMCGQIAASETLLNSSLMSSRVSAMIEAHFRGFKVRGREDQRADRDSAALGDKAAARRRRMHRHVRGRAVDECILWGSYQP
jgi:hypothetical protein